MVLSTGVTGGGVSGGFVGAAGFGVIKGLRVGIDGLLVGMKGFRVGTAGLRGDGVTLLGGRGALVVDLGRMG